MFTTIFKLPLFRNICLATGTLIAIGAVGCNPPGPRIDPAVLASYREQFQSPEELADEATVADVRETLEKSEDPSATTPVVLVGQIGGVPNPLEETQPDFPWRSDEASFFLVDQEVAAKLADHLAAQRPDHQDCPFCARAIRKSVDSMAAVNFSDENGNPIRIGARDLFDLQENEVVVVEGDASLLGGTMLVVDARKIYVKR